MTYTLSFYSVIFLMTLTAAGYALATIGMKITSISHSAAGMAIIALSLGGAAFAEIALLRHASLPMVYLGIVCAETLLVLGYAAFADQGITLPQIGGGLLVLAGFALVCGEG